MSRFRPPAGLDDLIGRASRLLESESGAVDPRQVPARTLPQTEAACGDDVHAADANFLESPGAQRDSTALDPRRKAIELLTRREHSRRELVRKLTERGIASEQAGAAVDELAGEGWQDDSRYAQVLVRSRAQAGHGPVRICAELRTHGLGQELIDAVLDACEVDWNQSARQQLQKRFGSARAGSRQDLAKQGAFLQRRGFSLDSIRWALGQGGEEA